MKSREDIIHKDVIIIGNGPSAICLSLMLSGRLPFVRESAAAEGHCCHPDEMLAARLAPVAGRCLVTEDVPALARGLEGRAGTPSSILLDALMRPGADAGLEEEPLVEWRQAGVQIDHLVLGKGPPGGSWHKMDPYILTLSLGNWMGLPEFPFHCRDSGEKRAYAHNVANYYLQYVKQMNLSQYFWNNCAVKEVRPIKSDRHCCHCESKSNWVKKLDGSIIERIKDHADSENEADDSNRCFISRAIKCFLSRKSDRCSARQRGQNRQNNCCKKLKESEKSNSPRKERTHSVSLCCKHGHRHDRHVTENTRLILPYALRNSCSLDLNQSVVPLNESNNNSNFESSTDKWLVEASDVDSGERLLFSCNYLVIATGVSDSPNRLEILKEGDDPDWLVHDLRSLEIKLDEALQNKSVMEMDPVLVIGSGLSAADAVIAARARNIPVIHVFRSKTPDFGKHLPENMYPEYHKVREMMKDDGNTYPLYTAYPECTLSKIDKDKNTVTLTSKSGEDTKLTVSFAAVLIGARPDLSFLPEDIKIGVKKDFPVDCKANPVDFDPITYCVKGYDNLFVVGPLAGDSFVRFIPGGALAIVTELYKRKKYV